MEVPDLQVPPVGVAGHQLQGLLPGGTDDDGDVTHGDRPLHGSTEVVELPVEVHRFARPQGPEHLEGLVQPSDAGPGRLLVDAEHLELGGHRSPTQAQVEPAATGMVDRRHLLGQDGRVAKGVTQHEVPHAEPLGPGRQPCGRDQRLVHGLGLRHGRGEVVHEGHAGKAGGLGVSGVHLELLEGQAHLGQVQVDLGHGVRLPVSYSNLARTAGLVTKTGSWSPPGPPRVMPPSTARVCPVT